MTMYWTKINDDNIKISGTSADIGAPLLNIAGSIYNHWTGLLDRNITTTETCMAMKHLAMVFCMNC